MFLAFFGVFFAFFGGDVAFFGVISRFWGYFRAMRPLFRAQRENFFELIFRNGAEQNGGLPPWRQFPCFYSFVEETSHPNGLSLINSLLV